MSSESLFGTTMVMLESLLDFQAERHTLISTNIANVDTPGYKGHDLHFSDELKRAITSEGALTLEKTHESHFPLKVDTLGKISHRMAPTNDAINRLDGNTVDLDKETAKLAENSLYYNTSAQIVSKKLRSIKNAISEVR